MRTTLELSQLIAQAIFENSSEANGRHWFIDYSGHVNELSITLHPNGWAEGSTDSEISMRAQLYGDGIKGMCDFLTANLLEGSGVADLTLTTWIANAIEQAMLDNTKEKWVKRHWFINYAGHVNTMDVRVFPHGWQNKEDNPHVIMKGIDMVKLDVSGINLVYWFVMAHLRK